MISTADMKFRNLEPEPLWNDQWNLRGEIYFFFMITLNQTLIGAAKIFSLNNHLTMTQRGAALELLGNRSETAPSAAVKHNGGEKSPSTAGNPTDN